ncbi:gag-protease polyprotein, related [Cucumis melo var. makuwa]|uniref:Gag-protease polyprotein, related n=1 Tax=Cucumis melo var. makuwa TaxID=1194695 RepID=A0A5A7V3N0_CUCMM|nr:gag-protease polyprotein, related [Cucumis melo var. makuwa]
MKVTIIEEANDVTTMKLDELFGSLRTFELSLNDNVLKKKSSIEIQGVSEDMAKSNPKQPQDENLAKTVALLSRRFSKFKSKFYKKSREFGTQSNKKTLPTSATLTQDPLAHLLHHDEEMVIVVLFRLIEVSNVMNMEDLNIINDCENFGRALISSVTEGIKEELPVVSKKKELKTTLSELEEVLSMWEKDQEVLLSYLGNNCEDDEKGKPLLTIRPQSNYIELLFLPVKLTCKLADETMFTKKGDDEKPFEFKIDEGTLILLMFFDHGKIRVIMVLLTEL